MQIQAVLLLLVASVSAWVSTVFRNALKESCPHILSNVSTTMNISPQTTPSWVKAAIPTTSSDTAHLRMDAARMVRRGMPARE